MLKCIQVAKKARTSSTWLEKKTAENALSAGQSTASKIAPRETFFAEKFAKTQQNFDAKVIVKNSRSKQLRECLFFLEKHDPYAPRLARIRKHQWQNQ